MHVHPSSGFPFFPVICFANTMLPSLHLSANNLILQASLSLFLALALPFLRIPTLVLQGLHTYIHPDDVNPGSSHQGTRAAITRRVSAETTELKPRKKSKDKFEFDENKAQIFRLKLNDAHLHSRLFFKEFQGVFNFTVIAASSLLVHNFFTINRGSGIIGNGSLVPILLGNVSVARVFILIARVSFEGSASTRSEKQLCFFIGALGFFTGLIVVFEIVPRWVFDFRFDSLDGSGKLWIAVLMGCLSGFLYVPAAKNARSFWLGTDQIRCNLAIIYCGWIGRTILCANYLLIVFTFVLWINPFTELVIKKKMVGDHRDAEELVGNMGMLKSDFENFRFFCLLLVAVIQILALRPNLQMFLNEAVLSWYQRLHSSKVPDMDYSRAKVFLHNHYLGLTALQFIAPPLLVLLFLGLSQIDDNLFEHFPTICHFFPCSAMVKEVALLLGWWVVFVWAILTSVVLVLYRRGSLRIL